MTATSPPLSLLLRLSETRGLRAMLRSLAWFGWEKIRTSSPFHRNQTGFGCGVPSAPVVVNQMIVSSRSRFATRRPNSDERSIVIEIALLCSELPEGNLLSTLPHSHLPIGEDTT